MTVQRGTNSITGINNTSGTTTATISAVNTSKSAVKVYASWSTSVTPSINEISYSATLTSSTQLSLNCSSAGAGTIYFVWEVVDFS